MRPDHWLKLSEALLALPFPPAFQVKFIGESAPYPVEFEADVSYWGTPLTELGNGSDVEWIRIKPRYLKHRGRLVEPEVVDCAGQLREELKSAGLAFEELAGDFVLLGKTVDGT